MRILCLFILLFLSSTRVSAEPLTLREALDLAGRDDPALAQIEANIRALDERAVADRQLPDPKASLALQNFPTDNFSRSREGMTQIVVGVSQAFPRGNTLAHQSHATTSIADGERARFEERQRGIERSTRLAWFDLYYWGQATQNVERSERLLRSLITATETLYSTAGQNAQDVVGAEFELSILQDKKIEIGRQIETSRAELAKWIGRTEAQRELATPFPQMPRLMAYDAIAISLTSHPQIRVADSMIQAEKHGIRLAQDQYRPGFNVNLNYGLREGDLPDGDPRPDFLTAKVTFDVPLFTRQRQDRMLAASRNRAASAEYRRDDVLRNLMALLEADYANWQAYDERVRHYYSSVIGQANQQFESSLQAYQEDQADFTDVIRTQMMELDAQLTVLRLKVDKAKAQTRLLYLQGDMP